jgi:hypothetical protein
MKTGQEAWTTSDYFDEVKRLKQKNRELDERCQRLEAVIATDETRQKDGYCRTCGADLACDYVSTMDLLQAMNQHLEDRCRVLEMENAGAMALVMSHEAHIERLEKKMKDDINEFIESSHTSSIRHDQEVDALKGLLELSTSDLCRKVHIQKCHVCEDSKCCDNTNPILKRHDQEMGAAHAELVGLIDCAQWVADMVRVQLGPVGSHNQLNHAGLARLDVALDSARKAKP